jgi:NAD(P)H-flavin reductase
MSRGLTTLTPAPARIVDAYDDGRDARHFTFELEDGMGASTTDVARPAVAPGQFFMLTVPGVGEIALTYVTPPDPAGRFDALVRRVGRVTRRLFELGGAVVVGVRGPFGRSWPVESLRGRRVLVLTGGCGLAPLASALDALAAIAHVDAVVGARDPAAQVLARERARWRTRFQCIETFDVRPANDAGKEPVRLGTPLRWIDLATGGVLPDAVLTCGPEVMMDAVAAEMTSRGVPPDAIFLSLERRMHCGVGTCGHCYLGTSLLCTDGPTLAWKEVQHLRSRGP